MAQKRKKENAQCIFQNEGGEGRIQNTGGGIDLTEDAFWRGVEQGVRRYTCCFPDLETFRLSQFILITFLLLYFFPYTCSYIFEIPLKILIQD